VPTYAILFTLKPETIRGMMDRPSDRAKVVSESMAAGGGRLVAMYWMFGQYDGLVIADMPDSGAAAAASLAVSSTGAFGHLETHELIPAADINPLLERAKGLPYQAPGA
jgi:uncharacterized protein with GYD domain